MKDDRATVLDRIRSASGRRAARLDRASNTAALPKIEGDLAARFAERAVLLSSDVVGPLAEADAPRAVADYLRSHHLPLDAVCWPALAALHWRASGIETSARAARGDDLVGITGAFCGIAETGTLLLLSGDQTPATVSLLPETHVALLPAKRLVARMEDAWSLLRREHRAPPRAVNFVSGPSRTADIEQTVTLGAHGPYRVLIVLTN
ncbi:MAG: hypothetical protein AMJ72_11020 [Acidithiobacillales bacterium SM1_46]|jgi:L-lactate dehydrogenase complex protein LldG|nr:MAG: hypothetical protein AMJ72_11020 [Acidithiobacillales bacterium SM1_46]